VKVAIEYCEPGNHEKVAKRLAEAIAAEFGGPAVEIETHPSAGGVFEVRVDGRLVYSKRATFRFPSPDEIFYHVRAAR
jgi:selenoprotein W-related protein